MRVGILTIVPSPYQRDLFEALAKHPDVDLRVFYCEAGSPDSPWAQKAPRSFETILPGFYLSWGGSRFLVNRTIPPLEALDVLILNGYMTLAAQRILRFHRGKVPMIFWAERMVGASTGLKGMLQRFFAKPLKRVSSIVAIGSRAQKDYQQRFHGMPVHNIPYYCSLEAFSECRPAERPRKPLTFFLCGQMIARKGVDVLLQAFAKLIDGGYDARLLLVGREAELPEMLAGLSPAARDHVDYAGFQQPEDLPQFFAQADVFVLPSRYDGWGVVVNQALGAALPIVCSDTVGAAVDLVDEGQNGFTFKNGDVAALHRRLEVFIQDSKFVRHASECSAAKARQWAPEVGAAKWVEILDLVCPARN